MNVWTLYYQSIYIYYLLLYVYLTNFTVEGTLFFGLSCSKFTKKKRVKFDSSEAGLGM